MQWVVGDFAYRFWVRPRERDSEVLELRVLRRGGGGLSAVGDVPLGQMEKQALELVRQMLASDRSRVAAQLAGFSERNADPTIRPRGHRSEPVLYAAVARLFADGATRKQIAAATTYEESAVKSWLQRAREHDLLSGRELTPTGRRLLEEDGRDALAIVAAWATRAVA